MTKEEHLKSRKERHKLVNQCVKSNINKSELELLTWAMCQLFRSARTIDLLDLKNTNNITGMGCDATATTILKHLIKTKTGYDYIEKIKPDLLKGYRKPTK